MSEAQLPLDHTLTTAYQNNLLFTEHFLEHRVPERAEWESAHEAAADALHKMRLKRAQVGSLADKNESQLEEEWIQWIFSDILHIPYQVQVNLDYGDKRRGVPDYVFTPTAEQATALTREIYKPSDLTGAMAIGDAKAWGVDLDKASKNQRSPHQQIDDYLRYSELPWGILTNGRYWRLYERNSSKYNHFFMVDLNALLDENNINKFLYFYLFFRREAFTTDWLNAVLKGSKDYAETLRDSLEAEVFAALEEIAQGFLDYRRNRLDKPPTKATLATIYEESLVLLYRLLFIFYAESRGILPTDNSNYRQRSLRLIAERAKHLVQFPNEVGADDTTLYSRLKDLFFLIDEGDDSCNVPAYNGKLFNPKEHTFLDEKAVGDIYLSRAIDKLARLDVQRGRSTERVTVDYQDLEVSHLGTIYEKLLEYELDYATENLVTSGANQDYKVAKANQTPTKAVGQVYLRTGNNQRKVTGSYYTPDYIVRFIVEKTLNPLLLEITECYASRDDEGNWIVRDHAALRDALLAINVLDPATGSGHFAVDVVVYIAEWLLSLALELPEQDTSPDLSYWMRQVASSCIYAVDINPLAVELAKLSIWLKTLAKDKPLSFLNHHIRVGNSLVGTSLAEIEALAPTQPKKRSTKKVSEKQAPLFGEEVFTLNVKSAVGQMTQIEAIQADDISDVRRQEKIYDDLRTKLQPYEQLAHVWTAREFGLQMSDGEWEAVYTLTLAGTPTPRVQEIIAQAQAIANQRDKRFFHWDVAFPEVFFDANGARKANAGFDAVVGNPPYVRQERIQSIKPFLENHYDIYTGTADLFLYFYELGLRYLKPDKRLGFITSGTFYNSNSAVPFRNYVHKNAAFEWVANFGENQPFKEAEMVYPSIAIMRPGKPSETFKHYFMDGNVRYAAMGNNFEKAEWVDSLSEVTKMDEWRFQAVEFTNLFRKVTANRQYQLKENVETYRGIVTGLNDAFVISEQVRKQLVDQDPKSAEIIKPLVRGQDLRPWYQTNGNEYLVWTFQNIEIEQYPAVKKHLEQFKKELANRYEPSRGQCEWYELRPCSYYDKFDKPKIFWPDIGKIPRFSSDAQNLYSNDKGFFIVCDSKSLLAILNSRTLWFALSQIATPLRLRAGLWQYQAKMQFVQRLPIPELSAAQESELATIAESITSTARLRYQLHEDMRQTISSDLGNGSPIGSGIDLYQWWNFADESALNSDLAGRRSAGFHEIPLGKRSEWRKFLADEKAKHAAFTQDIITHETRLNAIVYAAFGLDASEQALIESATKYPYGEV
jgi:type I restriction-modification system DNA methylase subunit